MSKNINEKNIFLNNLNGIFQIISVNLVTPFAGLFLKKRLNAGDELISLLNSLPAFFSVIAIIFGLRIAFSFKNKKKTTCILFFITRLFYLLMAFVVFVSPKYRALFFVFLYGALNFPGSIANFMWQSLFADIFAPSLRGKLLSIRNSLSTLVGTATTLITGIVISKFASTSGNIIIYYQVMFIAAFIIGCFEVLTLYLHKEGSNQSFAEINTCENPLSIKFIKIMLKEKEYVRFLICVVIFHFAWQMGWPVFLTYEVDYLKTNELWSSIISAMNGISMAYGYTFWRKFSDKKGSSFALALGIIGMGLTPFIYAISTSIKQFLVFTIFIGFSTSAVMLLFLKSLYEVSPRENRTSYLALYNLITNITLIFAPWVGMKISLLVGIRKGLLIIGLLRLSSSLFFFKRQFKGTVN